MKYLVPLNTNQRKLHGFLLPLLFLLTACASCPCEKLHTAAVKFEESVSTKYLGYVAKDETLSEEDKMLEELNITVHRAALKKFKKAK